MLLTKELDCSAMSMSPITENLTSTDYICQLQKDSKGQMDQCYLCSSNMHFGSLDYMSSTKVGIAHGPVPYEIPASRRLHPHGIAKSCVPSQ